MRYSSLLSTSSSSRIESSAVGGVAVFFAAALAIFIVTVRVCFPRSVYVATSSHHIFAVLSRLVFSPSYLPRFLAVLSFPIVSSCRFAVLAFSLAFSSSAITFSSVCKVVVVLLFLNAIVSSTVCRVVDAFVLARAPTLLRVSNLGIARALSRAHFCLNTF